MNIEKKLDVLGWMKIHYLDRECLNETEEKELEKFVNELKEAIDYTRCCETLNYKKTITFEEFIDANDMTKIGENHYSYELCLLTKQEVYKNYIEFVPNI